MLTADSHGAQRIGGSPCRLRWQSATIQPGVGGHTRRGRAPPHGRGVGGAPRRRVWIGTRSLISMVHPPRWDPILVSSVFKGQLQPELASRPVTVLEQQPQPARRGNYGNSTQALVLACSDRPRLRLFRGRGGTISSLAGRRKVCCTLNFGPFGWLSCLGCLPAMRSPGAQRAARCRRARAQRCAQWACGPPALGDGRAAALNRASAATDRMSSTGLRHRHRSGR